MAIDYTSDELIADVKQRASVPTTQNLFDESKFVRFLSNKMHSNLVPLIMAVREDYFVTQSDQDITAASSVANKYPIPSRAIGMKLRDVVLVADTGEEESLPRITYKDKALPGFTDFQRLWGFYIEGNNIRLHQAESFASQTLRFYWYRRPNRIVKKSLAGQITGIVGNIVSLDNAPTTWDTTTLFDVIDGQPGFQSRGDDQTITLKSGFDLTFTSVPTGTVVGDWVAEAGESPIPQIPWELFPLLAQTGVIKVLEALKDVQGIQMAMADYGKMSEDARKMLSPRVDDEAQKAVSRKGVWRTGGARNWRR